MRLFTLILKGRQLPPAVLNPSAEGYPISREAMAILNYNTIRTKALLHERRSIDQRYCASL